MPPPDVHDEQRADEHEEQPKISLAALIAAMAIKTLAALRSKDTFIVACVPGQQIVPEISKGVIKWIHNTTNAAVQLTLIQQSNPNAQPLFSQSVPAGASMGVFIPFKHGLFCIGAGSSNLASVQGCNIGGYID